MTPSEGLHNRYSLLLGVSLVWWLLLLDACAPPVVEPTPEPVVIETVTPTPEPPKIEAPVPRPPRLTFSEDRWQATLTIPNPTTPLDSLLMFLHQPVPEVALQSYLKTVVGDSLKSALLEMLTASLPPSTFTYHEQGITINDQTLEITYAIDTTGLAALVNPFLKAFGDPGAQPIRPLFSTLSTPPTKEIFRELSLPLPCAGVEVPKRTLLLPNAPRKYRHGIHRGIDFVTNWGSPVRSVATGVVIRADNHFEEVAPAFRKMLLRRARAVQRTPSDVFDYVLLGRALIIDHGLALVPGYRAVSIYAHLSGIEPGIQPGVTVKEGQIIGYSGNSGTRDSTLGKKGGAHLHWELILQNPSGEYYLGQGLSYEELYPLLVQVFSGPEETAPVVSKKQD